MIAFGEPVPAELLRLAGGHALSVQGASKVESHDEEGEAKIGLTHC